MFKHRGSSRAVILSVLALFTFVSNSRAQTVDPTPWVTNGPVYTIARFGETLYLGGDFTEVSAATGAGVVLNPSTAAPVAGFPQVVGRVYAVLSDGAGGWYIGGAFTHVDGLPRSNLAHITSGLAVDGSYSVVRRVVILG